MLPLALALELAVEDESELKMLMLGDMMLAEFYGLDPHVKRLAKAKFGRFYYYCSEGYTTPDIASRPALDMHSYLVMLCYQWS